MAADKETQRLDLAVSEAVRKRLDQYAKHIPVVDGTDKKDLRKWLQGIDHARDSVEPGDALIIDMLGPLVTGAMALFVRKTLKTMGTDKTWNALRTAVVNQYLGKGETRYWKDRVEKIHQESGETVREYAGRFMYQVHQAYTPTQLSESVLSERLLSKFIQGISSRMIRGTVSMLVEEEIESLERRVRAEEQETRRQETAHTDEGTAQEIEQATTSREDTQCALAHRVDGLDLQKLVDVAASVAFGYEKEEEEELETAALPPPPPMMLAACEESPQYKEMTGTFKSFQKDFRTFMSQQQDQTRKLHEEIAILKETPRMDPRSYQIPFPYYHGGYMGTSGGAPGGGSTQIHNHFGDQASGQSQQNQGNIQGSKGWSNGNNGGGRFPCWSCGQVGHFKRQCPNRGSGGVQTNNVIGGPSHSDRTGGAPMASNGFGGNQGN